MIRRRLFSYFSVERECFLSFNEGLEMKGIINLNISRIKRKNAIGIQMLKEMNECLDWLLVDDNYRKEGIKVMIIKSNLKDCFSSGADLKERSKMNDKEVASFVDSIRNTFTKICEIPFPTLSAIDGIAFGGGLEITLCSDIRISSHRNDHMISLPECQLGIIPGGGGTQRLPKLIGPMMSKYIIFSGEVISSSKAYEIGLVMKSIQQNKNGNAAYLETIRIAKQISNAAPLAIIAAKKAINHSNIKNNLDYERLLYHEIIKTKDRKEGLESFLEKRRPKYTGK